MRLYRHDDPQHVQASELLPWFVNGTLDPLEHASVERHLSDCIACKQELARLRALQDQYRTDHEDAGAARGLARLQARIEEIESGISAQRGWRRIAASWNAAAPWIRAALIVQSMLLAALITLALRLSPARFDTVADAGNVRLIARFDPATPESDIRSLLLTSRVRIVDGPRADGAYILEVEAQRERQVLDILRASAGVRRAEPATH